MQKKIYESIKLFKSYCNFKILFSTSAFCACAVDKFFTLQLKVIEISYHMQKELCKSDKPFRSYNKINTCHFKLNAIIPLEKFYL